MTFKEKAEMEREDLDIWFPRLELDSRFYSQAFPIIYWFFDEYRFLSNFHLQDIIYNGKVYPSTEHLYQACKTDIPEIHEQIRTAKDCGTAKKMGQCVTLISNWEEVKESIMREAVSIKFNSNAKLAYDLIKTKDSYLVEANTWHDCEWGICIKRDCQKCSGKRGKNMLGKILMEVRSQFVKDLKEAVDFARE